MSALSGLNTLLGLGVSVLMLLASLLALRHVGGKGALLMMIGTCGGMLMSLVWVVNAIGSVVGMSLFLNFDMEVVAMIYGGLSLLNGLFWFLQALGVLLVMFTVGAVIKQSAVLAEIRADQGSRAGQVDPGP